MTVLQWWRQGGGGAMTKRLPVNPAPGPLEHYAQRFDDLFSRARAQREGFRRYLEGLLLPAERNKTLTALASHISVALVHLHRGGLDFSDVLLVEVPGVISYAPPQPPYGLRAHPYKARGTLR